MEQALAIVLVVVLLWAVLRVARFFVKLVLLAIVVAVIIGAYFYFF
jgi:hypothetical protein